MSSDSNVFSHEILLVLAVVVSLLIVTLVWLSIWVSSGKEKQLGRVLDLDASLRSLAVYVPSILFILITTVLVGSIDRLLFSKNAVPLGETKLPLILYSVTFIFLGCSLFSFWVSAASKLRRRAITISSICLYLAFVTLIAIFPLLKGRASYPVASVLLASLGLLLVPLIGWLVLQGFFGLAEVTAKKKDQQTILYEDFGPSRLRLQMPRFNPFRFRVHFEGLQWVNLLLVYASLVGILHLGSTKSLQNNGYVELLLLGTVALAVTKLEVLSRVSGALALSLAAINKLRKRLLIAGTVLIGLTVSVVVVQMNSEADLSTGILDGAPAFAVMLLSALYAIVVLVSKMLAWNSEDAAVMRHLHTLAGAGAAMVPTSLVMLARRSEVQLAVIIAIVGCLAPLLTMFLSDVLSIRAASRQRSFSQVKRYSKVSEVLASGALGRLTFNVQKAKFVSYLSFEFKVSLGEADLLAKELSAAEYVKEVDIGGEAFIQATPKAIRDSLRPNLALLDSQDKNGDED